MDSLTQFVLGASVGEAVLGKKVGNKAIVWGGIGGTIPDLDVLFNPLFDEVTALMFHRGISHSIFFPFIIAPILGYLVHKFYKDDYIKGWIMLFFWSIFTHPLLDLFTGYGTGLLVPFYDQRFQLDTIFIIDPLYTLPILIAVVISLFYKRSNAKRWKINLIGLGIAQLYLLFTIYHKITFDAIVKDNLASQSIEARKFMTAPAALNNVLWWALVETEDEYLLSYYSFFDSSEKLRFRSFPKNHGLLTFSDEHIDSLIKFSKGFYTLQENGKSLIFNDLRFGTITGWFDFSKDFIFSFDIEQINGNIYIKRRPASSSPSEEDFARLIERVKGI